MEKSNSRRDFLKKTAVVAGLSQLLLPEWARGFSTLFSQGLNPAGEFSLLKLEKLLPTYSFPFTGQFSTGSFQLHYSLYNLYGNKAFSAGEFSLNAESRGERRQFIFTSSRLAGNGIKESDRIFNYVVSGNVVCKNNGTLTPEKWCVSSRISGSETGTSFGITGLVNNGEVKHGEVRLNIGKKTIRKPIGDRALSWKWGLLAVVQRMAEDAIASLQFALLDEFDALYQIQELRFRRKAILDCGNNREVEFKIFELTGDGVLPTVYWVDNMNRTIFAISGMEAYVLKS